MNIGLIVAVCLAARSRSWSEGDWLFVGGILFIFLLIKLFSAWRGRKRTRDLEAVALEQGFAFSAQDDQTLVDELLIFQLFCQGRAKRVTNVLTGQVEDTEIVIFDYRYVTGSGKHSKTHNQTVLLMRRPGWDLPQFCLSPESLVSKIGKVFGYDDINFEMHPEFSRRYNLAGQRQLAVRRTFTEELIGFYESSDGLCTQASETRLILYRAGKRVAPADIADFYALGWSLREVLPSPVAQEMAAQV